MDIVCISCGDKHVFKPGDAIHILSEHPHHGVVSGVLCHAAFRAIDESVLTRNGNERTGHFRLFPGVIGANGRAEFRGSQPVMRISAIDFVRHLPVAAAAMLGGLR
jgi:hypothetical protein